MCFPRFVRSKLSTASAHQNRPLATFVVRWNHLLLRHSVMVNCGRLPLMYVRRRSRICRLHRSLRRVRGRRHWRGKRSRDGRRHRRRRRNRLIPGRRGRRRRRWRVRRGRGSLSRWSSTWSRSRLLRGAGLHSGAGLWCCGAGAHACGGCRARRSLRILPITCAASIRANTKITDKTILSFFIIPSSR